MSRNDEYHSSPHDYVPTTEDQHSLLNVVQEHAEARYSNDPMKLAQLQSAIATCHMVVDQLVERSANADGTI